MIIIIDEMICFFLNPLNEAPEGYSNDSRTCAALLY